MASQNSNQDYGKSWTAFQDAVKSQAGSIWFVEKPLTTLVIGATGFIGGGGIVVAERLLVNTEAKVLANEAAASTASSTAKVVSNAATRYPGVAKEYAKQTVAQLQKTIRSTTKTISDHVGWLKDPLSKPEMTAEKWAAMSEQSRNGFLRKWASNIERNKVYLEIAEELLKSKL